MNDEDEDNVVAVIHEYYDDVTRILTAVFVCVIFSDYNLFTQFHYKLSISLYRLEISLHLSLTGEFECLMFLFF